MTKRKEEVDGCAGVWVPGQVSRMVAAAEKSGVGGVEGVARAVRAKKTNSLLFILSREIASPILRTHTII